MKKLLITLFLATFFMQNVNAQNWIEVTKTIAPDRDSLDEFGYSVSISGTYAIVGAPFEDEDSAGVNSIDSAGSAYILERNGNGIWQIIQKLVASDRDTSDVFGYSVSISGIYAIVGAPHEDENSSGGNTLRNAGSAYIFERDFNGNWNQVQKLVASGRDTLDEFGFSVSISGNTAIVGAYKEDEDSTGGNYLLNAGSVHIFERDTNGNWDQVKKINAIDREEWDWFGYSVSISGNNVIVGALHEDDDSTGGNNLPAAGSAYLFERDGNGNWKYAQKIVASDRATFDFFGVSVSVSGNYAIVGAYWEDENATGGSWVHNAGSAYIFKREGNGNWKQVQKIVASDRHNEDLFGCSVSIDSNYAIVGAYKEDAIGAGGPATFKAGSAFIFERDGNGYWNELQKLIASDWEEKEFFGFSVSINSNFCIVGANFEDEDINGGNTLNQAGAAYIFDNVITGIYVNNLGLSIHIYPNPTSGDINVDLRKTYKEIQVRVRNIVGQVILSKRIKTTNLINLKIEDSPGLYFVEIYTNDGNLTIMKIVKK